MTPPWSELCATTTQSIELQWWRDQRVVPVSGTRRFTFPWGRPKDSV
jgi:hypothetical protein